MWVAGVAWGFFLAVAVGQLFFAPFLGIANNGDYSKVSGYYRLAPVVGWGVGESEFYLTEYEFAERHGYESGLTSSEHVFVWPAVQLSRMFRGKEQFSLLAVAVVKLVFLAGCGGAILLWLAARGNWLGVVLVTLWLADGSTLCYLPGFYMDAAAMLFAVGLAASCLWWEGTQWAVLGTVLCGLGMVMSKSQHAPLAAVLVVGALVMAARKREVGALLVAVVLGAFGYRMLTETTQEYAAVPAFTLMFTRVAPAGDWLGLPEEYHKYLGKHAYSEGSPIEDRKWREEFSRRVSLGRIGRWYVEHPVATAGFLWEDARRFAGVQPDAGLGWRRKEDGFAPRSQEGGFGVWKRMRLWLTPLGLVALWLFRREWRMWMGAGLAAVSFAVASLADALETARHLYLFQVFADGLAIAAVSYFWPLRLGSRRSPGE